ncbi:hypothetical protein [Nocardia niwae]|uniref:Uncharacterized protein n=1 Tax=Nocardia niwae TaxID=626084 RepID=A0ABV2X4N6_9NOCA
MASSNRPRQAKKLARLAETTGAANVECLYLGPDQRRGGWKLCWNDGPTADQMQAFVTARADQVPDFPCEQLRYSRTCGDLTAAICTLLWLDADPAPAST